MLDQEFADKLENAKEAFKINAKNGKIAVQKKTKKSAYKVKVTVNAAGNDHYEEQAGLSSEMCKLFKKIFILPSSTWYAI